MCSSWHAKACLQQSKTLLRGLAVACVGSIGRPVHKFPVAHKTHQWWQPFHNSPIGFGVEATKEMCIRIAHNSVHLSHFSKLETPEPAIVYRIPLAIVEDYLDLWQAVRAHPSSMKVLRHILYPASTCEKSLERIVGKTELCWSYTPRLKPRTFGGSNNFNTVRASPCSWCIRQFNHCTVWIMRLCLRLKWGSRFTQTLKLCPNTTLTL